MTVPGLPTRPGFFDIDFDFETNPNPTRTVEVIRLYEISFTLIAQKGESNPLQYK